MTTRTSAYCGAAPALAFLGAFPVVVEPARAADHLNLEEDLPVTVEDAYPIPYRGREAQGLLRYDRTGEDEEGDYLFTVEPRLELGLFRDFQASLKLPYRLGDASDADSGDVEADALYNFNTEGLQLPAFALSGGVSVPYSADSDAPETTLKFIATKTLTGFTPRRLHLNLSWSHIYDAEDDERDDRYAAAIGYSQPLGPDVLLVADVVREQEREEGIDVNLAEVGVRYQLTPLTVLTAGGGVGLGDDSPDFRLVVGFQHSLTFFPLY